MDEQLSKYFSDSLNRKGKEQLFNKIEEDDELKEEYAKFQNIWALSGMVSEQDEMQYTDRKYRDVKRTIRQHKRKHFLLSIAKYAASAILLFSLWFVFERYVISPEKTELFSIEAPKGQRTHLVLSDGTQVWLNSRSQLKITANFNKDERIVELDGEGYFQVSKNENKPFIVKTKQYDVFVTGTTFNVFAYAESSIFETDLIEGSVTIYDPKEKASSINLFSEEKAFVESGILRKKNYSYLNPQYIQDGIYSFEDYTLQDIAKRLELWYDVKINITNPQIANYSFSGKFRQTDHIENIIKAIMETGKFKYRIIQNRNVEFY